jgi:DnaK suppressor protein
LLLAAGWLFLILRAIPGDGKRVGFESLLNRFEERMKPLLSPDYRPSETEPFMNPMQQEYFRQKLLGWKAELLKESTETLTHLQEESLSEPDIADRASLETDRALELRTRDRERKLISKIDEALIRIEDGTYGFCEETGEPIGIKRLEARPIATLSIEAQERHERMERTHRDD